MGIRWAELHSADLFIRDQRAYEAASKHFLCVLMLSFSKYIVTKMMHILEYACMQF